MNEVRDSIERIMVSDISGKQAPRRAASPGDDGAKLGKREENRRRKLVKIAKAAKQVLSKEGFDAATMQQIAKLAGVATGTLFNYADNKRDIAYLAMADDYAIAFQQAAEVSNEQPFVEQIIECWRPNFAIHNANLEMAKIVLSEFLFFAGKQARRHGEGVVAMKAEAARRARLCQQRGELTDAVSPTEIADLAYYLFQGVVRRWVQAGAVDVGEGVAMLHRALSLGLSGLMVQSES